MIDPPDRLLGVFRDGDDDTLPTPTGGEDGLQPFTDYEALAPQKNPKLGTPMFRTFRRVLNPPGGALVTDIVKMFDDEPDYWVVSLRAPIAGSGAIIRVYNHEFAGGDFVELIAAGAPNKCVIPGRGGNLLIVHVGATDDAYVQIAAVRAWQNITIG